MRRFGKYEILDKIGEGGFGVIYRGRDPHIQRDVAIKTCTSEDSDVRDRFFREAQIAGNLHHRNITVVYDFGIEEGVPYLVQEYLSGEDLDRKIRRRDPLPLRIKLRYLVHVARGLSYAHRRGVIHRDIKPSNVRILDDGTARIMDFGIAKVQHLNRALTETGETIGTAAYLSPEQIRGEEIDRRADIFSFGALAYELISGERPFQGENPSTVLYRVLTSRARPLRELAPDCPPELETLVERCLSRDRSDRYDSCDELLLDLGRIAGMPGHDPAEEFDDEGDAELPPSGTEDTVPLATLPDPPSLDEIELRPPQGVALSASRSYRGAVIKTLLFAILLTAVAVAIGWRSRSQLPEELSALRDLWPFSAALSQEGAAAADARGDGPSSPVVDAPSQSDDRGPTPTAVDPELAERSTTDPETPPRAGDEADAQQPVDDSASPPESAPDVAETMLDPDAIDTPETAEPEPPEVTSEAVAAEEAPSQTPALLTIRQYPGTPQAWVEANGRELGTTPIERLALPAGTYQVTLWEHPDHRGRRLEQRLGLTPGSSAVVSFDLSDPDRLVLRQSPPPGS